MPPPVLPAALPSAAAEIKVLEVDAFASVQDLIHAAIVANRGSASLKDVSAVCFHDSHMLSCASHTACLLPLVVRSGFHLSRPSSSTAVHGHLTQGSCWVLAAPCV